MQSNITIVTRKEMLGKIIMDRMAKLALLIRTEAPRFLPEGLSKREIIRSMREMKYRLHSPWLIRAVDREASALDQMALLWMRM